MKYEIKRTNLNLNFECNEYVRIFADCGTHSCFIFAIFWVRVYTFGLIHAFRNKCVTMANGCRNSQITYLCRHRPTDQPSEQTKSKGNCNMRIADEVSQNWNKYAQRPPFCSSEPHLLMAATTRFVPFVNDVFGRLVSVGNFVFRSSIE